MAQYDVIVIGGGISGSNILRVLSHYDIKSLLLEKNQDIASGVTKGNGGVVHSGYDAKAGTLKAKLNVLGAKMYPKLSKELGFPYENKGTLTVAFNDEEMETLQHLYENGVSNGVEGLRIVDQKELQSIEPHVNLKAIGALYSPAAGITDPYEVAYACAENAIDNGSEVKTDQEVIRIKKIDEGYEIHTNKDVFTTRYVINCAGVHGDTIAKLLGQNKYELVERHGTLMIIEKAVGFELNATLFPVPGKATKGMAAIPACAGNIILGSTATIMNDKEATKFTKDEANMLFESASKLVPDLKRENIIRIFTGLRPVESNSNNDFVIEEDPDNKNFFHVIGIQSPGVASAPAIALYVMDLLLEKETFNLKENIIETRDAPIDFSELTVEQKQEVISKNKNYANVICRCETVTEQEILNAIHGKLPANTVDAIKRRTRAGMGRCQGGFCLPKILNIINRELNIEFDEILLEEKGSEIIWKEEQ